MRRSPLKRHTPLKRTSKPAKRRTISPASPEQRVKVRDAVSIVSAQGPCDPAHLWPRGRGGCDHADCVVPLTREEHRAFDAGELDLLPYLQTYPVGMRPEVAHALTHCDLLALVHRLSGEHYAPERRLAA